MEQRRKQARQSYLSKVSENNNNKQAVDSEREIHPGSHSGGLTSEQREGLLVCMLYVLFIAHC